MPGGPVRVSPADACSRFSGDPRVQALFLHAARAASSGAGSVSFTPHARAARVARTDVAIAARRRPVRAPPADACSRLVHARCCRRLYGIRFGRARGAHWVNSSPTHTILGWAKLRARDRERERDPGRAPSLCGRRETRGAREPPLRGCPRVRTALDNVFCWLAGDRISQNQAQVIRIVFCALSIPAARFSEKICYTPFP